nr:hypothetical protein QIA33_00530 [Borreliella valaisiana]
MNSTSSSNLCNTKTKAYDWAIDQFANTIENKNVKSDPPGTSHF